jgi:hypothetical protein
LRSAGVVFGLFTEIDAAPGCEYRSP